MNPLQRKIEPPAPHIDDVIDDTAWPDCVRNFLRFARLPAICKVPGISDDVLAQYIDCVSEELRPYLWRGPKPTLFADLIEAQVGSQFLGHGGMNTTKPVKMKAGQRVRVVMGSRFGDVGISPNLKREYGYIKRLSIAELTNFSETAERPLPAKSTPMSLMDQEAVCTVIANTIGAPRSNIGPTTMLDEAILGPKGKDDIAEQIAQHFEIPEFEREPAHWTRVSDVIGEVARHLAAQALRDKGDAMAAMAEDGEAAR